MSARVNSIGKTAIEVTIEGETENVEYIAKSTTGQSIVKVSKASRWFQVWIDGWRYDMSQETPGVLLLKPSEPNAGCIPGFGLPETGVGHMDLEVHVNEPVWVCKNDHMLVITGLWEPALCAVFIYLAVGEHTGRPDSWNSPPLPVFPPSAETVTLIPKVTTTPSMETGSENKVFPTKTNPRDGATMVLIPAGEFWIGDDMDTDYRRAKKTLPDFYMYKDLVTVAQYMKFCNETGHEKPHAPDFNPSWQLSDHPIVNISLYDAWDYCKWAGVRMPTELEWEKAARGTDGRVFPWGNEWKESKCANGNNSQRSTVPVGKYTDSPYGLSDMAGNVCQLTVTSYETIPRDRGDTRPDTIVVKGNSWKWNLSLDLFFRSAHRARLPLDRSADVIGFRCAADADWR